MISYKKDNLQRHNVTVTEVDEVLNGTESIWLDLGVSISGNDRLMFVGFTKSGRILEVGVELVGDDEIVFHAMNAGKKYLEEFTDAQKRN
ncbi:MAG: hypothetical protein K2Y22_02960 [Candidatus Obscuribacterales bacterium]|nr:hypothetical protein [Candidatus Obscuribacterales bacterium]